VESEPIDAEELFPGNVVLALGLPGDQYTPLAPAEEACILGAVDKRVREFRAGRACAGRALAELGIRDFPLVSGPDRAPVWPEGVVGSITHCRGFVAAAVTREDELRGLGLDAEPAAPLDDEILELICTPPERAWLSEVDPRWATALFSAKEAVYKCLHPVSGAWLDFQDVTLTFDAPRRRFRLEPGTEVPGVGDASTVRGRYVRTRTHWITGASLG